MTTASDAHVKPVAISDSINVKELKRVTSVPDPELDLLQETYRVALQQEAAARLALFTGEIKADLDALSGELNHQVWVSDDIGFQTIKDLLARGYTSDADTAVIHTYKKDFAYMQQLYNLWQDASFVD